MGSCKACCITKATQARLQLSMAAQVSDIMSNMVEAGWLQQYDYDKLMTLTEAAQACHSLLRVQPSRQPTSEARACIWAMPPYPESRPYKGFISLARRTWPPAVPVARQTTCMKAPAPRTCSRRLKQAHTCLAQHSCKRSCSGCQPRAA